MPQNHELVVVYSSYVLYVSLNFRASWQQYQYLWKCNSWLFFLHGRTCYRPCSWDCASGGSPLLLQYKLLTLPLGILANHNVVRLSAFSEAGVLQERTSFTILEQGSEGDPGAGGNIFGIRDEAGRGIIFTLRPLQRPGLVRLRVQATTLSTQGRITYQSIFIIYISISRYPYWAPPQLEGRTDCVFP